MSKYVIGEKEYTCGNDCQQTGCPGHKMTVVMNCSVDIYEVIVDGKERELFDENYLHTLMDIIEKK